MSLITRFPWACVFAFCFLVYGLLAWAIF